MTMPFYVNEWLVDPSRNKIKCGKTEIKLEPKVMAVLICLAQSSGEVISREHIENTAWAGLVVGYGSLGNVIIKLRKAFGDNAKKSCYIETVSKKGYRLIAVTRMADKNRDLSKMPDQARTGLLETSFLRKSGQKIFKQKHYFLFALLLITLVSTRLITNLQDVRNKRANNSAIPTIPVIAVLPFKNLSRGSEQEYYSDGLTADLIVDLAKLSKISVIARNSVFAYKNLETDLNDVGETLGAHYIVEGSVQRLKNKLRITVRLTDVKNKLTLWAERYDGKLEDVFDFQDKVVEKIVSSLEVRLSDMERERLAHKYSNSIEAYDEFLKGWQLLWLQSKEGVFQSRGHFFETLKLDDKFARAYANISLSYIYDYLNGWSDNAQQVLKNAHLYADKGLLVDDSFSQVHFAKGLAYTFSGEYQKAIIEVEKSLALNPNFADGYGLLATALNYGGKPIQAEVAMLKAMRLNSGYPGVYMVIYGEILFNQYKYKEAIKIFEAVLDRNPEYVEARRWLAATLAIEEQLDEANWQVELLRASGSNTSIKRIEASLPFKDPEQAKYFIEGLRKAGFTQ